MKFKGGDHVEYKSTCSEFMFRGVVVGLIGKDQDMAICTDQTGLSARPVRVKRLLLQPLGRFAGYA